MHKRAIISCFMRGRNYRFVTDASTFSRAKVDSGTRLLIDCIRISQSDVVLDLGCGYGPIGIVAANLAAKGKCYMVDINMRAVELAKKNIKLNNVKNAEARLSDGFERLDELTFDEILTNPPISAGRKVVASFIEGSYAHLNPNGCFYLVARTRQGAKTIKEKMNEIFKNAEYASMHGGYRVIVSKKAT